ncbi:MAG TPA: microcin ABC transporter permease, partial [bacterium]|nr:microcin ABC transporter permease [bacterium]
MAAYLVKRILLMIPTLFGIILITFLVLQLVPGGPVERMLAQLRQGQQGSEAGSLGLGALGGRPGQIELRQEQIDYLNKLYGFDQPLPLQFWGWLKRLFTFNFGDSYYRHRSVVRLVEDKLPVSLSLG